MAARNRRGGGRLGKLLLASLLGGGCLPRAVPDPATAVRAYAEAVKKGDGNAVYELLSSKAQQASSKEDILRQVAAERTELTEHARLLAGEGGRTQTRAELAFADGERAFLVWEGRGFRVLGAGTLPGGAGSPEGALDQLRRALSHRSYTDLLRVLTSSARKSVETDVRALVQGLEHPESLPIQTNQDTASVPIPGGHHVKLRREGDTWRVEDFD